MIVYRIVNSKHASDLSGTGAALYPGRWNKMGSPVLYTGVNREIALLENIVHNPPMFYPQLDILTLEIPDDSISEFKTTDLPKNWFQFPAPTVLSEMGQEWIIRGETVGLKVPSSIIHSSSNIILNCRHPGYGEVKLLEQKKFNFDPRLIK